MLYAKYYWLVSEVAFPQNLYRYGIHDRLFSDRRGRRAIRRRTSKVFRRTKAGQGDLMTDKTITEIRQFRGVNNILWMQVWRLRSGMPRPKPRSSSAPSTPM